jgi:hypothetical protein
MVMPRYSLLLEHAPLIGRFQVWSEKLRPALRRHATSKGELLIVGDPIHGARRDDASVLAAFCAARDIESFARSLDGTFLIIVRSTDPDHLSVISDRFASYGFYYSLQSDHRLTGALSLTQLVNHLGGFVPNETACMEFLHLRRIFGEKTYDRRCHFLGSASILSHDVEGGSVRKYWQPQYGRERLDMRRGVDAIVAALRGTMRTSMDDAGPDRSYALFMSGGLDSRALLAAAESKPLCVTTCDRYNNEADVAETAARTVGAPFLFVPRRQQPYDGHVAEAVFYGGGQHVLTEAHFLAYDDILGSKADCFFMGLGLDVFLGGLYLPKSPVRWLGRDTLHFSLKPLPADLSSAFIGGVKYRLSTSNAWDVVRPAARSQLQNGLHASIEEIVSRGRALGAEDYDLWEYLHLHNFGRHYSLLMIQSVRHWAECRAPAFCNELFDIAITLPARLKVNSETYLAALNRLSPALMRIRNANTNVEAGRSFRSQSAIRAARIVANRLGAGLRVSPTVDERSWPSPKDTLNSSRVLNRRMAALKHSGHLEALRIVDLGAVGRMVDDHIDRRADHSTLLLMLITLDEFCRQVA